MIRVNLLPDAPRARSTHIGALAGTDSFWGVTYAVSIAAVLVGVVVAYMSTSSSQDELQRAVLKARQETRSLQSGAKGLDELRREQGEMAELRKVVETLKAESLGPGDLLATLSSILSAPTPALERTSRGTALVWDTRRVWLTSMEENGRICKLSGLARTNEDVAEFMRRLETSAHFQDIKLERTEAWSGKDSPVSMIAFTLEGKVTHEPVE